jgi:integrase
MARQRRKRGTGKIAYDRTAKQYIARTSDGIRSGRFATRQAAEQALSEWNEQQGRGANLQGLGQQTQYYFSVWLAYKRDTENVKPSTLLFYERHLNYAIPFIGKLALEAVTTEHIERCLASLRRAGLSPRSVEHVRSVLRNAFNTAIKWYKLQENPAKAADHAKIRRYPERALTSGELAMFFGAIQGDRLEALYHLALTLGMRRGELLGVRWKDMNWKDATVKVVQQITTVGSKTKIDDLKTESSRRVLPLTQSLLDLLKAHEANQKEEARIVQQRATDKAKKQGHLAPLLQWNTHDLLFCSEAGTPILPRNMTRHFKHVLLRAGLPPSIRLHDLRHTALTNLAAVAEAKAVQSIAGHADIDTTMRVYAGKQLDAMRIAIEAAERRYRAG